MCSFNYPEVFSWLIVDFGVSMFALPGTFVSSESLAHRGLALLLKSVAIHLSPRSDIA